MPDRSGPPATRTTPDEAHREDRPSGGRWAVVVDGHEAEMTYSRASPTLIITDCDAALELRPQVAIPVAWLAPHDHAQVDEMEQAGTLVVKTPSHALLCHGRYRDDVEPVKSILHAADPVALAEPFHRVREALAEAKKLGATKAA